MKMLPSNLDTVAKATWWPQNPGGNWYWRCAVPGRHLPGPAYQLRTKDLVYDGDGIGIPRQKSATAIWCYPGNASRGIIMRGMQQAGFRVLIEVDDNYMIGHTKPPGTSSDWVPKIPPPGDDTVSLEAHTRLARFVDGIIVTTEELARAYRQVNDHVYVCPNSVDPDDWEEPEKPTDGVFRIGYAASHSHYYDAADVKRALGWAANQPGVEVVMFGIRTDMGFPTTWAKWTDDLPAYRRSLQILDLGVCPLRPGPWADCKSPIKMYEYTMAGAATIVSRTMPYVSLHDQPFVLTADTPKDFFRHVKWCVRNQDGVREMARKAKEYVLGNCLIEQHIHKWQTACAT